MTTQKAFMYKGEDFVTDTLEKLVDGLNNLTEEWLIQFDELKRQILRGTAHEFSKDLQVKAFVAQEIT